MADLEAEVIYPDGRSEVIDPVVSITVSNGYYDYEVELEPGVKIVLRGLPVPLPVTEEERDD